MKILQQQEIANMIYRCLYNLSLLLLLSVATNSYANQTLSAEDKLYGLSVFWKEASYNFAYFDQVKDLDWDGAYQRYIPKVLAAKNDFEYYRVMSQFAALLNDGMTVVQMPVEIVKQHVAFPAIRLAEAHREAIVVAVEKSLSTVIPLGSVITGVDGVETHKVLTQQVFPFISSSTEHILWDQGVKGNQEYGYGLLAGKPNSEVKVSFVTPEGSKEQVTLTRISDSSNIEWYSGKGVGAIQNFEMRWLDDKTAYVALNNFSDMNVVDKFKAALPELQKAKGLVLDLRFNQGGNTFLAEEILAHLTFKDLIGPKSRMRVHNSTYKAWGKFADDFQWAQKYVEYFKGQAWEDSEANVIFADQVDINDKLVITTAILISRDTAKAAEDFLVYADGVKHFKTIGEPTFGSTGQPLMLDLPGGLSVKICTKRETFADGRDFVGYGIQPNIHVERDADYYLSEQDITLEKAHRWLGAELKKAGLVMAVK